MSDEAWTWTGITRSHNRGLRAAFFLNVYLSLGNREKPSSRRARAVQFCHIFQFIQRNWVVRITLNTWYHLWLDYVPRGPTPPVSWTVYHVTRHHLGVVLCTTWPDTICDLDCVPRDPTRTCRKVDGYSFHAPDIPSYCIALCEEGFNS